MGVEMDKDRSRDVWVETLQLLRTKVDEKRADAKKQEKRRK